MATSLYASTKRERHLADFLRSTCIEEIVDRDQSVVCTSLSLASSGLKRLLAEPHWDLQKAFRVADILNLRVADELLFVTDEGRHET